MALGDLVPLAPINPPVKAGSPAGAPTPDASTTAATASDVPAALLSAEAIDSAQRTARAQGLVVCRQEANAGHMYSLLAYLAVLMIFGVYSLSSFWPRPTPNEQVPARVDSTAAPASPAATDTSAIDACDARKVADLMSRVHGDSLRSQLISICYFQRPRIIWKETQLVLLVLFGGGVGAVLSCLRKSTLHFYKGDLCVEGLPGLYVWPFTGALTALVFYAFIRGGFFSGQSTIAQTSPYSFIAAALLSGMFTHEVTAKLRQVAETLLTRVDSRPTVPPTTAPRTETGERTSDAKGRNDIGERGEIGAPPAAVAPPAPPPDTVG